MRLLIEWGWWNWRWASCAFLWVLDVFDRWPAFGEWLRSPGFGGAAAVVAAAVAYAASRANVKAQRDTARLDRQARIDDDRKSQWWRRAQWALDLTLSDKVSERTVGFEVLNALAQSEWAQQHEADVIAAATEALLAEDSTPRALRRTIARRPRRQRNGDR